MSAGLRVGTRFEVSMQWRLGDDKNALALATFAARVEAIDHASDRLLCRLVDITRLRTSHPPDEIDSALLAAIKGLVGKYAYLPTEASEGTKLHLKLTTLSGALDYFFDERPDTTTA